MSPSLPVLSGLERVRALERAGFRRVSQKGSHVKLRLHSANETRTVIVPLHDELAPGTLRSILRQAGITGEDLRKLI